MEIGGVALLTAIILVAVMIPHFIQRRAAIMESREGDRFSPNLHLVRQSAPPKARAAHCGSCRLISPHSTIHRVPLTEGLNQGGPMSAPARRPVSGAGVKQRAHELAQLRSRRAARRSAEAASAQRRIAAAGSFAALTVVTILTVAMSSSLSWLWVFAPVAGLGVVLVLSRRAAIQAEAADATDRARLQELTAQGQSASNAEAPAAHVAPESEDRPSAVSATPQGQVVRETSSTAPTTAQLNDSSEATPSLHNSAQTQDPAATDTATAASAQERQWVPGVIPPSRYSQGSRIQGRVIHADTDLRGIPKVAATVPARPIAATEDPAAQSTQAVAASVPLAFNLDEVLEARRA